MGKHTDETERDHQLDILEATVEVNRAEFLLKLAETEVDARKLTLTRAEIHLRELKEKVL